MLCDVRRTERHTGPIPGLTGDWWRASSYRLDEKVTGARRRLFFIPEGKPMRVRMGWEQPEALRQAARSLVKACEVLEAGGVSPDKYGVAEREIGDTLLPWVNLYGLAGLALVNVVEAHVGFSVYKATARGWDCVAAGPGRKVTLRSHPPVDVEAAVFHGAAWDDFQPSGPALPLSDAWWAQYREPPAALYRAGLELRDIRDAFLELRERLDDRRRENVNRWREKLRRTANEYEDLRARAENILSARRAFVVERDGRPRLVTACGTLFEALVSVAALDAIDDDSPLRVCACGDVVELESDPRGRPQRLPQAHQACRKKVEKKTKARAAAIARRLLEAGVSDGEAEAQVRAEFPGITLDRVMRAARAHKLVREGMTHDEAALSLGITGNRGVSGGEQVRRLLEGLLGV